MAQSALQHQTPVCLQLRVIIPGHVGARHVKWLSRIILSEHESQASSRGVGPLQVQHGGSDTRFWLAPPWPQLSLHLHTAIPALHRLLHMAHRLHTALQAPWQQRDYRLLPQSVVDHEGAEGQHGWASMPSVQVMPVQVGSGPSGLFLQGMSGRRWSWCPRSLRPCSAC